MALIDDLRDDRANAISTYYSSYVKYLENLKQNGDNSYTSGEDGQLQAKYKIFNDLVIKHHNLLQKIDGYVTGSYLDPEEGTVGTGVWWGSCEPNNSRIPLFITDKDYAESINSFFILNTKDIPNQRHPYVLWNQEHSVIGSYNNKGWKNANGRGSYNNSYNPLKSSGNYRLGEPLEWWGDSNNLVWGNIVHDGYYHYRWDRLKNNDDSSSSRDGFYDYFGGGRSINDPNVTVWEIMRYSYWGSGSNTSVSDQEVTATYSGYFTQSGDTTSDWNTSWYLMWTTNSNWRIIRVYNTEVETTTTSTGTTYTTKIYYDNLIGNSISEVTYSRIEDPQVPEANKTASQGNVYDYVWQYIYNNYYSSFETRVNNISTSLEGVITQTSNIINFDYTAIEDEAGEKIGKSETETLKSNLESWLTEWKNRNGDTGSGANYNTTDSKWSISNLDALVSSSSGGLAELLNFNSSYDDDREGIIGNWIDSTVKDILGDYALGDDESWNPSDTTYSDNNSGNLGTGQQLYVYRHDLMRRRIQRSNDGVLFNAWGAYKTWNKKVDEISNLETRMSNIVSDYQYDLTPQDVEVSTDEEDKITIEWDDIKGASSYDVEYKESISGTWIEAQYNYGYTDPEGPIPNFGEAPSSKLELQAYTRGYQEFGLDITDVDNSTSLVNDLVVYDFYININGETNYKVKIKGVDAQTWDALNTTIQNKIEEDELEIQCEIANNDIRITSDKKGIGSTIEITSGNNNDLLNAIGASPESPVDGTQQLFQGRTYYFRVRVNNGYSVSLGSDGNRNDKDWNSRSEWSTINYTDDKKTHGDVGYITWDEAENLTVSGFPNDSELTPSYDHVYLTWDSVDNAANYKIYRATSEDGGYSLVGSTSSTEYYDTEALSGMPFFYKVQAVASDDFKLYNEDNLLELNLTGPKSTTAIRGKRLWEGPVIDATKDNRYKVTITWNEISGANGYLVYRSDEQSGEYNYITNSDGSERIVENNYYVDAESARQFLAKEFDSPQDGFDDYKEDNRYYFIVLTEADVKQYYIVSPQSGTWKVEDISSQINDAISAGLDNVYTEIMKFKSPSEHYKLVFKTREKGSKKEINVMNGTFGESLFKVLGEIENPENGVSPMPSVSMYYQVEALELVDGVIVRRSEKSNKAEGNIPVI